MLVIYVLLLAQGFLVQLESIFEVLKLSLLRSQVWVLSAGGVLVARCPLYVLDRGGFGETTRAPWTGCAADLALDDGQDLELNLFDLVTKCLGLILDGLPTRLILFGPLHARNLDDVAIVLLDEIAKLNQVVLHLLVVVEYPVGRRAPLKVLKLLQEVVGVHEPIIAAAVFGAPIQDR